MPFATPSQPFSEALIYRFRVRPLTAGGHGDAVPFTAGPEEYVFNVEFSAPESRNGGRGPTQEGACTTPAGETACFTVNDECGDQAHGVRVFAGPRWDPFIMDARAALETISTGKLAFTGRPGINREVNYFFVKELGAQTISRGAHQTCCRLNVHVRSSGVTLFEN